MYPMNHRPPIRIPLIAVFGVDGYVVNRHFFSLFSIKLAKISLVINRIIDPFPHNISNEGDHIIIGHNPDCTTTSHGTFIY